MLQPASKSDQACHKTLSNTERVKAVKEYLSLAGGVREEVLDGHLGSSGSTPQVGMGSSVVIHPSGSICSARQILVVSTAQMASGQAKVVGIYSFAAEVQI